MTAELTIDPAGPGGDKSVTVVVVGWGRTGKTGMRMALLDALAKGQVVLVNEPPATGLLLGNELHFRMAERIPPPPPATPLWSADYRNKRGRR